MRRFSWVLAGLALVALLFSVALAKDNSGGGGKGNRNGQGRPGGPPVLFGEITALNESGMTIKPEIPEQMAERMKERREKNGREMPKLPDSITIKFGPDTKWYSNGAEGSRKDFAVGDKVVVKMLLGKDKKQPVAEAVADPETAKQYIMDKMRERRGEGQGNRQGRKGGQGGPEGDQGFGPGPGGPGMGPDGQGMGPGGPGMGPGGPGMGPGGPGMGPGGPGMGPGGPGMGSGGQGMGPGGPGMGPGGPGGRSHPVFGAIISVDRDSVTVRPEVPDFVAKMMKEHDMPMPKDLPDTLTLPIDQFTVFIRNEEKLNKNPFVKGERVVLIMGRDENDEQVVRAAIDLMTAKDKITKMMEQRGERREQGRGPGPGPGMDDRRDQDGNREGGRRNPR